MTSKIALHDLSKTHSKTTDLEIYYMTVLALACMCAALRQLNITV